jgi:hypothetical protein
MKRISLGVAAILLTGATVFANKPVTKIDSNKVKQACQGRCLKTFKTRTCKGDKACSDMKTCGGKCS